MGTVLRGTSLWIITHPRKRSVDFFKNQYRVENMSIINIENTNLLKFDLVQGIVHQSNCFNTMGSGIAKQIREKYPEAYEADCRTTRGDQRKLGYFSWVKANDGKYIYNCYSQYNYGLGHRHTNYEAIFNGLTNIKTHAESCGLESLGLPHLMGCKLGGGSWRIVNAIIEEVFADDPDFTLYICRYDP